MPSFSSQPPASQQPTASNPKATEGISPHSNPITGAQASAQPLTNPAPLSQSGQVTAGTIPISFDDHTATSGRMDLKRLQNPAMFEKARFRFRLYKR